MATVGHFRNPENAWAEQYAESLGIVARYGDGANSIYIAENFTKAISIVHDAGLRLPARILDDPRWFKSHYPFAFDEFHATTEQSIIRINSHSVYWEEQGKIAREIAKRFHEEKAWWSSGSEMHVALHELMHVAQYLQIPGQWTTLQLRELTDREQALILADVSEYAAISAVEFLAETGVGLLSNKAYSDEIMELYFSLKGVPI